LSAAPATRTYETLGQIADGLDIGLGELISTAEATKA
jgi:hypothetical protein